MSCLPHSIAGFRCDLDWPEFKDALTGRSAITIWSHLELRLFFSWSALQPLRQLTDGNRNEQEQLMIAASRIGSVQEIRLRIMFHQKKK